MVFWSEASDLVANDTNGTSDVFVRDLMAGTTTLVSVNSVESASGNGESFPRAISRDGRYVLFVSAASDLAANDTNGRSDVFVRDLTAATTTLVSINNAGNASGNGSSGLPSVGAITPDGRYVLFESCASNLVANDTNGTADVFVRDLRPGSAAPSPTQTPTLTPTGPTTPELPTLTATATPIACVGDCDTTGEVTGDEIIAMVNIALGNARADTCTAGDANRDRKITVDEIITAVNNGAERVQCSVGLTASTRAWPRSSASRSV